MGGARSGVTTSRGSEIREGPTSSAKEEKKRNDGCLFSSASNSSVFGGSSRTVFSESDNEHPVHTEPDRRHFAMADQPPDRHKPRKDKRKRYMTDGRNYPPRNTKALKIGRRKEEMIGSMGQHHKETQYVPSRQRRPLIRKRVLPIHQVRVEGGSISPCLALKRAPERPLGFRRIWPSGGSSPLGRKGSKGMEMENGLRLSQIMMGQEI